MGLQQLHHMTKCRPSGQMISYSERTDRIGTNPFICAKRSRPDRTFPPIRLGSKSNHSLNLRTFENMISFKLTILGCGSALPTLQRNPTSQLLQYEGTNILIDCAEGTQLQLKKLKKSAMQIDHILISHLHGDHYFGLIGLITSMHLNGRTRLLNIYGPARLIDIIQIQLDAGQTELRFPLVFQTLDESHTNLIELDQLTIKSFRVSHRIPTWGFLFSEKSAGRKIKKSFVKQYKPSIEQIKNIKAGADYQTYDGTLLLNKAITESPPSPRSYAYSADTAYDESIIPMIQGVSLLYHEATFSDNMADDAASTLHSTATEAAMIAKKANVGQLVIGHYSSRYKDASPLLDEAHKVFPNTIAAEDGLELNIKH